MPSRPATSRMIAAIVGDARARVAIDHAVTNNNRNNASLPRAGD